MKQTTTIPAAQTGTDLKFRVTTTKEDFNLARDYFNIVVKFVELLFHLFCCFHLVFCLSVQLSTLKPAYFHIFVKISRFWRFFTSYFYV